MYMSRLDAARRAIQQGADDGLTAVAQHYTQRVRERIDRGYTTGNFSHHARGVAGRIMYTRPYDVPGGRAITCGTSTVAGFAYELGWELGHQNRFTRRFERVEIWRPYLQERRDLYVRMVARNIERQLASSGLAGTFSPRPG